MEIKSVETLEDGTRNVVATIDDDETQFLLEFAINQLLAMGVTQFLQENQAKDTIIVEGTSTKQ